MDNGAIAFSGKIDAASLSGLHTAISADAIFTLDFGGVTEISFSGLRTLIQLRKSHKRFRIINAREEVASFFDKTGASSMINVCRAAIPLDLTGVEASGESFTAKTYFLDNGVMAKVYEDFIPQSVAVQDFVTSRSVVMSGIVTPMASDLVKVGGKQYGILFERVFNKRSFARAMSQEPERTDEFAKRFALMSKELHSTQCDTTVFPDRARLIREAVGNSLQYTEDERRRMLAFMDSVPSATTCLHGDLHMGNVITNEQSDLWIDMGDFSYGNPLWDIAMLFFQCHLNPSEEMLVDMFHIGKERMHEFWASFAKYYFGADTDSKQQEVRDMMMPYTALHMVYLVYHFKRDMPFMTPAVRKIISESV